MRLSPALACCVGLLAGEPALASESYDIDVDGVKRSYELYIPVGVGAGAPLVVVLHGKGSAGDDELEVGRWQAKADREKFIVAAPDALDDYDGVDDKRPWTVRDWLRRNYRALRGRNITRWEGGKNDIDLIVSVIDRVSAERKVDRSRIYMVGYSRGGFMAHRMALEITDRLAGVAVVAADVEPAVRTAPARPLSFALITGERDPTLPVDGNRPTAIMERWRAVDRCPPLARLEPRTAGLIMEGAGPCADGTEILYVIAQGVGHHWNRAQPHYSDIAWAFLSRFRRSPSSGGTKE